VEWSGGVGGVGGGTGGVLFLDCAKDAVADVDAADVAASIADAATTRAQVGLHPGLYMVRLRTS